jgi:hypothetical protein
VQSVLVCGTDISNESRGYAKTRRTESKMIRWMCCVKLSDRKANAELFNRLGIESVSDVVRCGRLRLFNHFEHLEPDHWVSARRSVGRGDLVGLTGIVIWSRRSQVRIPAVPLC